MSAGKYIYRVVLSNLLTLYYSIQLLILFGIAYLKNPFSNPWAQKLKLEPPPRLSDPKYGVHKYIKANNTILHYVESGDSSKPMMLFLHGFPEFWYSWRHQIVEFKKDFWCIAVDMRGYGDSERPEDVSSYKIEYLVADVRDLIRQLGRENCIVVSHDWGGLIACQLRDTYPEVLSALVVLASASKTAWTQEIWSNPIQKKMSWYVFAFRVPIIPEKLILMNDLPMYEKTMLFSDKTTTDKEDIECYKYWFRRPFALTPPLNYYRANFDCQIREMVEAKGNVPMLVVHASNDPYLAHNILDTMKKQYNCVTMILNDTGHFLQQEDPVKVNSVIKDFLATNNILTSSY